MRIHYLSAAEIPSRHANSVQVMKMCAAFSKNGHEVMLFARGDARPDAATFLGYGCDPDFSIEICAPTSPGLPDKLLHPLRVARRARAAAAPDIVYSRHVFSTLLVARQGRPFIFEAHVLPDSGIVRSMQSWLFGRRNFVRLVTISEALRQDYLARFPGLKPSQVLVAHDAAELPAQPASMPARNGTRLAAGYVGSLYPGKGMEMIAELAQRMPGVDFLVAGGSEADLRHWRRAAPQPNITYLGHVPNGELAAVYGSIDIALAPLQNRVATRAGTDDISRWTSPLKIFEYKAHGKAIICSDLPVLREILHHEQTALMVTPDDPGAWMAALSRLADEPALRRRLGQAARRSVERAFTWEIRAGRVLQPPA